MASSSFAKAWFILSILVLAFGYGFASHAWGLFPKKYVEKSWRQGRQFWQGGEGPTTWTTSPVYDRSGANPVVPERMQPGLSLISSSWKDSDGWNPELRLFDGKGRVLHKWRIDRKEVFEGGSGRGVDPSKGNVHGSHLLPNGHVVVNQEYVGTARLDACGDVVWKMEENTHHSISRADDGTFWVSAVYPERRTGSNRYPDGFPGLKGKKVWVDRMLHVSEDGEILKDINVLDVLYESGLERYIPKTLGGVHPSAKSINQDVTHLNDVEPLDSSMVGEYPLFDAGDLVVSLRSLSLVFVFDPETLEVKWHSSEPFIYQHDPDFISDGWIGVFDNNYDFRGGETHGGSRIVAVQPYTDSTKVLFSGKQLDRFYTAIQGKWQHLENGNMLLSETGAARVVEVNSEGNLIWEWIRDPIDNTTVPKITNSIRLDLKQEDIASWPCSSVDSVGTAQKQQTAP
jgi:hypothetical protein